jgi:outer membrane protein assembly factor BamB
MCRLAALLIACAVAVPLKVEAGSWTQFRGPNSSGVAADELPLPAQIGPTQNVIWKTPLPPGHSSPLIHGERIYLTAVRDHKTLLTLALDRKTGTVLWEAVAPHHQLEKIHQIGSLAQPTGVTDGSHIISFFGSSGLLCYDPAGKLLWRLPMGPFKSEFGAGSSPLLAGNTLIINQDHDSDSFLMAIDKRTGKMLWKTDRSEFPVGFASPVIWEVAGKKQIVVSGTLRIAGYDFETGKEIWTVRGMARVSNMTPSVGPDGMLYVAAWAAGADPGDRFEVPTFAEMIDKYDANKNGTLELNEMPEGPLKQRFAQIDRDKDSHVTRLEYDGMRHIFLTAQNRMVAIKPGGTGDITDTHVAWVHKKYLPYVPSPVVYRGTIFLVKNGGIVSSLDAQTGKAIKQERVPGSAADYYSSPVAGDGKVYLLSERGDLAVISAEPEWKVLGKAKFGEGAYATPAIVDGRIYLRTVGHLYCFGLKR